MTAFPTLVPKPSAAERAALVSNLRRYGQHVCAFSAAGLIESDGTRLSSKDTQIARRAEAMRQDAARIADLSAQVKQLTRELNAERGEWLAENAARKAAEAQIADLSAQVLRLKEALEAQWKSAAAWVDDAKAHTGEAERQRDEMQQALRPFVISHPDNFGSPFLSLIGVKPPESARISIKVAIGDLRRARAAIAEGEQP